MVAYLIAYGHEKEHATELRAGLEQMVEGFGAFICKACHGEGQHEQMYTAGCGGGYFLSMGSCDYCAGTGLCDRMGNPSLHSVREQVLNAGRRAIADEDQDEQEDGR